MQCQQVFISSTGAFSENCSLTLSPSAGILLLAVDVSEFPDCSAIFIGSMSYKNFSPVAEVAIYGVASHTEFSLSYKGSVAISARIKAGLTVDLSRF